MNANACTRAWLWRANHADNPISDYLHGPLGLMLGLSLAIHLLALIGFSLPAQQPQLALPGADLAIHLQYNQARTILETPRPTLKSVMAAVSRPAPVPVRMQTKPTKLQPPRQTIIKPEVITKTEQTDTTEIVTAKTGSQLQPFAPTSHEPTKKPASRINLSRVISRLQQDLKSYFYYPRLARRKNIEGGVILGFAINRQGKIKNIRIVKSSGFAILDTAAEDALRQLDQLHWEQDYLQRNNQHIELPVIYQLTES